MQITKNDLGKNQVELTIEVSVEETKPFLLNAANKLSQNTKIPGFRPGKAPYETVKSRFGEMAILEAALDELVSQTFFKAVTQENLLTIGRPEINLEKIAPDNPVIYKAKVSLLPKVTLGDWKNIKLSKKTVTAAKEDLDKTLKQLQELNVKENIVSRQAKTGDKVEVDFEVLIDKVVIEGGKSYKYPVVIGEQRMIPGFEEQLVGLKTGDDKEFELSFPEKYFEKNLAGKTATFKIKVINVYERILPELNDEFAKNLAFKDLAELTEQIAKNIQHGKDEKEKQRVENEAILEIIKLTTIEDLPEILIDNEIHKMIMELEDSLMKQGMNMHDYLKSINKTHDDLHTDFRAQATERVKASLILREIANLEKITVAEEEIAAEISQQEKLYGKDQETLKGIRSREYREYLQNLLRNQKVIKLINETIIK